MTAASSSDPTTPTGRTHECALPSAEELASAVSAKAVEQLPSFSFTSPSDVVRPLSHRLFARDHPHSSSHCSAQAIAKHGYGVVVLVPVVVVDVPVTVVVVELIVAVVVVLVAVVVVVELAVVEVDDVNDVVVELTVVDDPVIVVVVDVTVAVIGDCG